MPGITTTRLPYKLGGLATQNIKGSEKIVIANYTTSNKVLKSKRMPTIVVELHLNETEMFGI